MWEAFLSLPRGRVSTRNFVMFFATLLVASFGYIFATAPTAQALDASWDGNAISYDGRTYTGPIKLAGTKGLSAIPSGAQVYQSKEKSGNTTIARLIYFTSAEVPKSAGEATYITYTLNPPNTYSDPSATSTITFDDSGTNTVKTTDEGISGCVIPGVGWMICPISKYMAEGMDYVYKLVDGFLQVRPLDQSEDSAIRRVWSIARDLANVAFVIAFMVVIYSQLTNVGLSSYGLKKLLPRIIIAAILVNLSFIICSLAVDASNILGMSINQLFIEMRNSLPGAENPTMGDINWESFVSFTLSGGALVGAGWAGYTLLTTAVAGAAGGLIYIMLPILLGVFVVIIITFLILAARQAIITILIVLAPLAFVAYLLPNTEKWFERWRDTFFTLLVMFPAFSVVFGGAQLAGQLIIRSATSLEQIVLGLAVQVAPLAITPLLLKLGGGLLNRFAGIVNNPSKGLVDRYKNYNNDRLGEHQAKHNRLNAEALANGTLRKNQFLRRRAAKDYAKKNFRETQKKADEEGAENAWHRQTGRWGYNNHTARDSVKSRLGRTQDGYGNLDTFKRDNQLYHGQTEAHHDEHYQNLVQGDPARRAMLSDTRTTEKKTKVVTDSMSAQDERAGQTQINSDTRLRGLQKQTIVDTGHADLLKSNVDAEGKATFKRELFGDKALKALNVQTVRFENEAAAIDATLKDRAEANWQRITSDVNDPEFDGGLRNLRIQQVEASDSASKYTEQYNKLIENIRAQGASAPDIILSADKTVAGNIKQLGQDIEIERRAQEAAKVVQSENLAGAFKASQEGTGDPNLLIQAGGIGGERAQTRIYAKAKSDVVNAAVEEVKTNRTLTSEMTRSQLHKLMKTGEYNGKKSTVEMQQAAMYALLQEKGNNQDANEIRDVIGKMGMMVDEDGNYFEALRDSDGRLVRGPNGFAQIDKSKQITNKDEIGRRRDWQQFFDDAAGGSPHSMVTYSGTNKSEARSGTMVDDIRGGFLRDATTGKFSPDKMLKADVDELKTLLEDIHSPTGYYAGLSPENKIKVNKTLESSILQLQENENINSSIDDRNRGVMNDILAEVNADYAPTIDSRGDRIYVVNEHKAIVRPEKRDATVDKEFAAPIDVPGVHKPGSYYKDWDVDLQL